MSTGRLELRECGKGGTDAAPHRSTTQTLLHCDKCSKTYPLDKRNYFLRHLKNCARDRMEAMKPYMRSFCGKWHRQVKEGVLEPAADERREFAGRGEFVLRPDFTFTYRSFVRGELCAGGGRAFEEYKATGTWGEFAGSGDHVDFRGTLRHTHGCSCGFAGRKNIEKADSWLVSFTRAEWEQQYCRPYGKRCFECGQLTHLRRQCPKIRCNECGELGHMKIDCLRVSDAAVCAPCEEDDGADGLP